MSGRRLIDAAGDNLTMLADADLVTKADLYGALGLRLTYEPLHDRVLVEAQPWGFDRVRGGSAPQAHRAVVRFVIAL